MRCLSLLILCLLNPVAERKQPARAGDLDRAISGFPFLLDARVVDRGPIARGSTGCQKKRTFRKLVQVKELGQSLPLNRSCLLHLRNTVIQRTRAARPSKVATQSSTPRPRGKGTN